MHIDPFGYEHLLYELACQNIKIKLCKVQRFLFQQVKLGDLFHYDGDPQIMVWTRMNDVDEETLWPPVYERFVLNFNCIPCGKRSQTGWLKVNSGGYIVHFGLLLLNVTINLDECHSHLESTCYDFTSQAAYLGLCQLTVCVSVL